MSVTARALWFIEAHLSDDLSLDAISATLGVSRFHLSRAFAYSAGLGLDDYVRGRRLSEAAKALTGGAPDIFEVALRFGYGSHEAFTRAFRRQFDQTPESVRAAGDLATLTTVEPLRINQPSSSNVAMRRATAPELRIFGLDQRYTDSTTAGIPSQWNLFVPYIGTIPGAVGKTTFGVIHQFGEHGEFRYLCGVEVRTCPTDPAHLSGVTLPPREYLVFQHPGHVSSIQATWKQVWDESLPASGCSADEGFCFERYGEEFDGHTGSGGCELWVPVKQ